MAFTPVTVTGTFKKVDGTTPAAGAVLFQATAEMQNGGQIRVPSPIQAPLDVNGAISVVLPATDDTGTLPTGVTFTVIEELIGSPSRPPWQLAVPHASATLDLSTVVPALPATAAFQYLKAIGDTATGLKVTAAGGYGLAYSSGAGDPHYNIKDPQFAGGAKGDGVTDDSAPALALVTLVGPIGGVGFSPPGTYLVNPTVLPAAGTTSLVLRGNGTKATIWKAINGNAPIFTISGGYHYDLTIEKMRLNLGANAINITTPQQLARLTLQEVSFDTCAVALNLAGSVIGMTLRNVFFNNCSGHNINHNGTAQVNEVLLEQIWFQSATFATYLNLPAVAGSILNSWTLHGVVLEGPFNASSIAAMILGSIQELNLYNVASADFTAAYSKPLIKTVAAANGAPVDLTAVGCNLGNGDGAIFEILTSGGNPAASAWSFLGGVLSPKAAQTPFIFTGGVQGLSFVGTRFTVSQGWSAATTGTQVGPVVLQNCNDAGTLVPFAVYVPSGYTGNLLDYQIGGSSLLHLAQDGTLTLGGVTATRLANVNALAAPGGADVVVYPGGGKDLNSQGGMRSTNGMGAWGHAPPGAQPAAPVTLADVIAIIRGCGLSA